MTCSLLFFRQTYYKCQLEKKLKVPEPDIESFEPIETDEALPDEGERILPFDNESPSPKKKDLKNIIWKSRKPLPPLPRIETFV